MQREEASFFGEEKVVRVRVRKGARWAVGVAELCAWGKRPARDEQSRTQFLYLRHENDRECPKSAFGPRRDL